MSTLFRVLGLVINLVENIVQDVRNGVSDEEIRRRLSDPDGVGQKILDEIRSNDGKFVFPGDA